MTRLLLSPWVAAPAALAVALGLVRLARRKPALRPIVGPFSATAAVLTAMLAVGRGVSTGGLFALLFLLPGLVLLVRVFVLAFQVLFTRSQGAPPPALLASVVAVVLYGLGGGIIAKAWFQVELTPFLATSAVVGAVVGLALQETLGNLFTGIALHTEAPFRVSDWIRVGDLEGRVEQMSWRATRLRTWLGDTLTIPNVEVSRRAVLNFSAPRLPHGRSVVVGVGMSTPPNRVLAALAALVRQVPGVPREPPAVIRIVAYKESAVEYEIRYFVAAYEDYRRVEGEILRLIWYHFRRLGIEIPFPKREVYVQQVEPAAAGRESAEMRLARTLRSIDLFGPLSDEEIERASLRFRLLHYAAGERVIQEGEEGDSFFVIDSGAIEVKKMLGGQERTLARLEEGACFGEMALLTGERRAATVVALTDLDLYTIDKSGFQDILAANPKIAEDISTLLSERREALSHAEGDVTAKFGGDAPREELKGRILGRIRSYFGL